MSTRLVSRCSPGYSVGQRIGNLLEDRLTWLCRRVPPGQLLLHGPLNCDSSLAVKICVCVGAFFVQTSCIKKWCLLLANVLHEKCADF